MSAADKSMKDKMMAARLKAEGDERKHCRCPMCHCVVPTVQLYAHLSKLFAHLSKHAVDADYSKLHPSKHAGDADYSKEAAG